MFRIGTKVLYKLPPGGRRKKDSAKKVGTVVGIVPANMEPEGNLDAVMFPGWDKYEPKIKIKDIKGDIRDAVSFLVMDNGNSNVFWPPADYVQSFHITEEEHGKWMEEAGAENFVEEEVEALEEAELLEVYDTPEEFVEDVVSKLKDAGFEDAVEGLDEEELETVVIDEQE